MLIEHTDISSPVCPGCSIDDSLLQQHLLDELLSIKCKVDQSLLEPILWAMLLIPKNGVVVADGFCKCVIMGSLSHHNLSNRVYNRFSLDMVRW